MRHPDRTTYLLRVWLPDRPGALGAVASHVGSVGGDIVAVDIVDRGGGQAVDDLIVELPADHLELMLREVRAVDGVDVEEVHALDETPPDLGLGVLRAAADLVGSRTQHDLAGLLCAHARRIARLDWAVLCRSDDGAFVASSGDAPDPDWLGAYAIGADAAPGDEAGGDTARVGAEDPQIAAARLPGSDFLLMAGRTVLSIRPRERALIESLCELAATRMVQLAGDGDALVEIGGMGSA